MGRVTKAREDLPVSKWLPALVQERLVRKLRSQSVPIISNTMLLDLLGWLGGSMLHPTGETYHTKNYSEYEFLQP